LPYAGQVSCDLHEEYVIAIKKRATEATKTFFVIVSINLFVFFKDNKFYFSKAILDFNNFAKKQLILSTSIENTRVFNCINYFI
jgi:hypothetical protein